MKKICVLLVMAWSLSMPVFAVDSVLPVMGQTAERHDMNGNKVRCYTATGVVRNIDRDNGNVTIYYDAVPALMWPPMTMPFAVKDRSLFDRFKVGEKIEFEFVLEARTGVIVGVK